MDPKVSIIIPYYNDGKYISDTLDSVKRQSYSNIEVIIVNDGSTDDDSIEIFKQIHLNKGKKLQETNAGPSAARNLGIAHATGKYILPLDADDKIADSYVEKAVSILEHNPQYGIVYCESEFFGLSAGKCELPAFSMEKMLLSNIIFNAGMFRRADWELCGGYDEDLQIGIEDWDFWLNILELGRGVYRIPEVLFFYRIKKNSRNRNFDKKQELIRKAYLMIQKKHINLYKKFFEEYLVASRNYMLDQENRIQHMPQNKLKVIFGDMFPILRKIKYKWRNQKK